MQLAHFQVRRRSFASLASWFGRLRARLRDFKAKLQPRITYLVTDGTPCGTGVSGQHTWMN